MIKVFWVNVTQKNYKYGDISPKYALLQQKGYSLIEIIGYISNLDFAWWLSKSPPIHKYETKTIQFMSHLDNPLNKQVLNPGIFIILRSILGTIPFIC